MSTFYEETGFKVETIWFKKVFFTILTIYLLFTSVSPVLYSGDVFAILIVQLSIVVYVIGCIKLSTLITYLSVLIAVVVQRVFLNNFNPYLLISSAVWIFFSEYVVEIVFKEKTSSFRETNVSSYIYCFQTIMVPFIYVFLALIIAISINYTFEYVLSTTPKLLQVFYAVVIETRLGAFIFTVLIIYLTYFFLNEYIYGLISDLLFTTRSYAQSFINRFLTSEYESIVNMNDSFSRVYRRILLLIILSVLLPASYPLLELFEFNPSLTILVILLNFSLSIILYYLVNKYLNRVFSIEFNISIRVSSSLFKISIILLVLYVVLMIVYSGMNAIDVTLTAIGFKQPSSSRIDVFSKTITSIYISISNIFYDITHSYVTYLTRTYSVLIDMLKNLIELMWGRGFG